jgi:hypothetical protein
MCQKAFGSLFGPFVSVERKAFELTRGTLSDIPELRCGGAWVLP